MTTTEKLLQAHKEAVISAHLAGLAGATAARQDALVVAAKLAAQLNQHHANQRAAGVLSGRKVARAQRHHEPFGGRPPHSPLSTEEAYEATLYRLGYSTEQIEKELAKQKAAESKVLAHGDAIRSLYNRLVAMGVDPATAWKMANGQPF
jgi:bisphosphoglycerate-dependent phosphoglycerate mutase